VFWEYWGVWRQSTCNRVPFTLNPPRQHFYEIPTNHLLDGQCSNTRVFSCEQHGKFGEFDTNVELIIRACLPSDAAGIESLFREFVAYLRSIGDDND
jgi:hypothetical protein